MQLRALIQTVLDHAPNSRGGEASVQCPHGTGVGALSLNPREIRQSRTDHRRILHG